MIYLEENLVVRDSLKIGFPAVSDIVRKNVRICKNLYFHQSQITSITNSMKKRVWKEMNTLLSFFCSNDNNSYYKDSIFWRFYFFILFPHFNSPNSKYNTALWNAQRLIEKLNMFKCLLNRVCVTHWRCAAWGLIYCTKRFNHNRPLVKRGGVYRWSDEKLNSGLGRRPKGWSYPDPVPVC